MCCTAGPVCNDDDIEPLITNEEKADRQHRIEKVNIKSKEERKKKKKLEKMNSETEESDQNGKYE